MRQYAPPAKAIKITDEKAAATRCNHAMCAPPPHLSGCSPIGNMSEGEPPYKPDVPPTADCVARERPKGLWNLQRMLLV